MTMKSAVIGLIVGLVGAITHAADSTRLSCDNGHVQMNIFEHRTGVVSRATDLTVVYGAYLFVGQLNDADGGLTVLTPADGSKSGNQFDGLINIDYSSNAVTVLSGELILEGQILPVDSKFTCKELN
jgi:hypothetical protein